MIMEIINSTADDTATIFKFYDHAIAYQKTKFNKHWQGFDLALIQTEIKENRQWKIMMDNTVVCIFAITFNDAAIWGDKDEQPSIYIHRIVTNPLFRGNNFVNEIITWAKKYGKENGRQFIRMDTWGDNQKLIDYYTKCGFTFLGLSDELNAKDLPKHYSGIQLSLFEIKIN
jgi:ribosomal protein S18 acetylase RimI-like enzyme